jgi:signal transduction histidine kinase
VCVDGGLRFVAADETELELLGREVDQLRDELAAQRRLSAMTVHDLSNPAQVVLGLSEVLLEHQNLDPMVRKHLQQLHRSAVTLTALVTDLNHGFGLDDTERLELERVDLVELVTSVVERTHVLSEAKQMTMVVLVDQIEQAGHRGCWVDGDSVRLERALVNLLGNAIKFSPPGSTVSVGVDRGVNFATVAVQDEGPGIPEEARKRIFEVFQREEETAHLPGLGLGLFIVQQIAESHGGTVSVVSEHGHGATFLFQVPLAVDALADPA